MLKLSFCGSLVWFVFIILSCKSSAPVVQPATNQPLLQLDERLAKIRMSELNGTPFTLQNTAGKPVFLNFWATWCRPCINEMQSLEEVYPQFKDDIVFIAVSPEEPAKIKAFQQEHKFSFPLAHLDIAFIDAYIIKLPTTLLIDRKGNLVSEEEGLRLWTQYNNLEKLKALAKP